MEELLSRLLTATQSVSSNNSSVNLIKFDPDEADADIVGWCHLTEIIVNSRKIAGPDLLLALTHSLKGRAAKCLTKLNFNEITWPYIKEILLAKFGKCMLMQDYFDEIMRFHIGHKETACEAAMRLWNLIESIPKLKMDEDVITGFAISVLSQNDSLIRRELNSHPISTKAQLCRVLNGISLKRRNDDRNANETDVKRQRMGDSRFAGTCHFCGNRGHKQEDCRKRRDSVKSKAMDGRDKREIVTCYACGKPGHLSTNCPDKRSGIDPTTHKDVQVCERSIMRGTLLTSAGKVILFLFDSGSACSLVKNSFIDCLSGTERNDTVHLTGIGGDSLKCDRQILCSVTIQEIPLTILLHVVPDNAITDAIIVGRDVLEQGIQVEINSDSLLFFSRKEVSICQEVSELSFNNIDTDLVGTDRQALIEVLRGYSDFFIDGIPSRRVSTGSLKIDLIDPNKIVRRRPYRLSPAEKDVVKSKVQSLLDAGVIRESSSPFASPILLVKKKDGSDRMVVDYRELNANTRPEHYPLPRIDEQVDRLSGAHYFSSLDMASGYHQIIVEPGSVERTAFVTPDGQYEYLAMPFGLRNAASVYQRCINKALKTHRDTIALAYMDDVLCFSSEVTEGLNHLNAVLEALSEAGFSLNIHKCKFMKTKIDYLGYVIQTGEVRPNPRKIQALTEAPPPATATQVRQFLGLASYFRRFIPNFATLAGPLYPLTKLKGRIIWTDKHREVHKKIVKILTSAPVLTIFNPEIPIELHTDASSDGYGAILIQRDNNIPRVVAYFSRRTTDTESRYHSYELETLAVVRAVENFRHYLYGQHFTVFTDCNSVKASKAKVDLSPRVHRWWAYLQSYDFNIVYKEGRCMEHADYLSRNPLSPLATSSTEPLISNRSPVISRKIVNFIELHDSWLQVEQKRDPEIQDLISKHLNTELPEGVSRTYDVRDGILYRKIERNKISSWLPIVPRSLIWTLINHVHNEIKHLGCDKTLDKIYEQYWFPQMAKNVRKFIDSCIVCKASKGPSGAQQLRLHPIPKISVPWHTIHIDLTGKLSGKSDKKEYVSVIIDGFTKYVLLEHTQSLDAACAVKALKKAVSLFGAPRRIIADQGRCYISSNFKEFCNQHNVELHLIATGSSRANGQVERVMRTLKTLLTVIENDSNKIWREELDNVQLALNSTRSRVTGYTPTELMFGIRAQSLGLAKISSNANSVHRADLHAIRNEASENIQKSATCEIKRFNRGKARVRPLMQGEYVFIKCSERNQTKLSAKYRGPFVITKVLNNDRYELKSIRGGNRIYKYSHENLRLVPKGFEGLVEIATSMVDSEEAETAVDGEQIEHTNQSDSDNDTLSIPSEDTLTAGSDTLSAISNEQDLAISEIEGHIKQGEFLRVSVYSYL